MTNLIIPILNIRLLSTNYFEQQYIYDICDLKDGPSGGKRPMQYTHNGEWINIIDFDQSNGMCYWRKTGKITSQELDTGTIASNKYVRLTIPLRLVAVVTREKMNVDSFASGELLANDILKVLNKNLNGSNLRNQIGARSIALVIESTEDNQNEILETELKGGSKLSPRYVVCAVNLSVVIDIQQKCIDSSCNLLTDCQALLAAISEIQKNQCILPNYDFSDTNVTVNLTDEQRAALTELLCSDSEYTYDLYVNGVDTGEDITVDGSDITLNLN